MAIAPRGDGGRHARQNSAVPSALRVQPSLRSKGGMAAV